ncbi:hypothetical protein IFM89_032623 [Coptis chinensis]|uniref:Prolamin-like domain-containing protein n=1 Tax=Coptis chinensis TaxID=261450 RepID=A0A835HRF2_9MAGN|nr:hypothetical protein IFM89_032623 [Coptis chinensis]
MAFSSKQVNFFFAAVLLTWTIVVSMTVQARPLASGSTLAARLELEEQNQCWESLMELRACTGEVVLFFLNGETYLGPSCCRAILVIEHKCWVWTAMLKSLGFTDKESAVLRDYCDSTDSSTPPPSPPSPSTVEPTETVSESPLP